MEIECNGQISEMGKITIDPSILAEMKVGSKIRLKITVPEKERKEKRRKGLSPATKRLLKRMKNAKSLGLPDDPRELSHSVLAEERMEEKFPWLG